MVVSFKGAHFPHSPGFSELVASFINRFNLLKYLEKIHAYAASLPMKRTRKRCGDHAHFVLRAATACYAFF